LRGERLVDNVLENSTSLNCIINLSTFYKIDSIIDVGRGKLGTMASRRLWNVRAVFEMNFGYNTSRNIKSR
jgi:hypothetical protein